MTIVAAGTLEHRGGRRAVDLMCAGPPSALPAASSATIARRATPSGVPAGRRACHRPPPDTGQAGGSRTESRRASATGDVEAGRTDPGVVGGVVGEARRRASASRREQRTAGAQRRRGGVGDGHPRAEDLIVATGTFWDVRGQFVRRGLARVGVTRFEMHVDGIDGARGVARIRGRPRTSSRCAGGRGAVSPKTPPMICAPSSRPNARHRSVAAVGVRVDRFWRQRRITSLVRPCPAGAAKSSWPHAGTGASCRRRAAQER